MADIMRIDIDPATGFPVPPAQAMEPRLRPLDLSGKRPS
jgi:hypothetical protein